jgi:anti-sigma factor RsiW
MSKTKKDLAVVGLGGLERLVDALGEGTNEGRHLSDEEFIGYAAGSLPEDRVARLDRHLERCGECARELERIASASEDLLKEGEALIEQAVTSVLRQFRREGEMSGAQVKSPPALGSNPGSMNYNSGSVEQGVAERYPLSWNDDADLRGRIIVLASGYGRREK